MHKKNQFLASLTFDTDFVELDRDDADGYFGYWQKQKMKTVYVSQYDPTSFQLGNLFSQEAQPKLKVDKMDMQRHASHQNSNYGESDDVNKSRFGSSRGAFYSSHAREQEKHQNRDTRGNSKKKMQTQSDSEQYSQEEFEDE